MMYRVMKTATLTEQQPRGYEYAEYKLAVQDVCVGRACKVILSDCCNFLCSKLTGFCTVAAWKPCGPSPFFRWIGDQLMQ